MSSTRVRVPESAAGSAAADGHRVRGAGGGRRPAALAAHPYLLVSSPAPVLHRRAPVDGPRRVRADPGRDTVKDMDLQVEQVELTEQPTAVVRAHVPRDEIGSFLGEAYGEVIAAIGAQGVQPVGMPFGRYLPGPEEFHVEAGFPTSAPVRPAGRVVAGTFPGGSAITILYRGAYDGVGAAYEAGEAWLAAHGWVVTAPPWETYLDDPEVPEPRTLVCIPSRPR